MTRCARIPYSQAEMRWLEANRTMVISDFHGAFCAAFKRTDVTAAHLHGLRKRRGWKVGRAVGRFAGRRRLFSPAEVEWLRSNSTKAPEDYLRDFRAEFARPEITAAQLKTIRKAQRWKTGRTGRFAEGHVPWTKGKKLPFNAGSARTQFKKGHPRSGTALDKYKPIGAERIHENGYLERKIHDGFPMQSRWQLVHRIEWEKANGPIPEGMVLKCLGDDKANPAPSNWQLVPRGLLPRLNNQWGRNYDEAPADLKPTMMAVARLEHGVADRRKQLSAYQRTEGS